MNFNLVASITKYTWLKNIVVILIALILSLIVIKITNIIIYLFDSKLKKTQFKKLILAFKLPLKIIIITIALHIGFYIIHIQNSIFHLINKICIFVYSVIVFGYLFYLLSHIEKFLGKLPKLLDVKFIPLIKKLLQFFILFIAFVYIVSEVFEKDIGAWLAGLGLAGLALSLAAQDTLKNIIGFITIVLDQPFNIGQRIVIDNYDGIVEDIGLRSIKLRTFDGHLISIPNSNALNLSAENIEKRPYIRRVLNIGLTYNTSFEKIQNAIQIIKNILNEPEIKPFINPEINNNIYTPKVYFNEYQASSLNIIVIYWYSPPDYWGYMEHCEKVNLRILQEFNKANINFAFPTQTIYLNTDSSDLPTVKLQNINLNNTVKPI